MLAKEAKEAIHRKIWHRSLNEGETSDDCHECSRSKPKRSGFVAGSRCGL